MVQEANTKSSGSSGTSSTIAVPSMGSSGGGATQHHNTAFIHKLYSMLEDEEMKDLIWWSPSQNSFLVRPSEKFSKAMATFFKHTNVASFVRQLNMYGFHKVSDHKVTERTKDQDGNNTDEDESINLWEFRHSMGFFKKGDKESLKSIKRHSKSQLLTARSHSTPMSVSSAATQYDGTWNDGSGSFGRTQTADMQDLYYHGSAYNHPSSVDMKYSLPPGTQNKQESSTIQAQRDLTIKLPGEYRQQQLWFMALQNRYDNAVEELRSTNMDMLRLLSLVEKTVKFSSVANQGSSAEFETRGSQGEGGSVRPPTPITISLRNANDGISPEAEKEQFIEHLNSEIESFKATILTKLQRQLDSQRFPPPFHSTYRTSSSVPSYVSAPSTASATPVSGLSSYPHYTGSADVTSGYGPYSTSNPISQAPSTSHSVGVSGSPYLMMNPFAKRKSNSSTSKKRHMSVFMDPLAPGPLQTGSAGSSLVQGDQLQAKTHSIGGGALPYISSNLAIEADPRYDIRYELTSNPASIGDKRPYSPPSKESPPHHFIPFNSKPVVERPRSALSPNSPSKDTVISTDSTSQPLVFGQRITAPLSIPYRPHLPYGPLPPDPGNPSHDTTQSVPQVQQPPFFNSNTSNSSAASISNLTTSMSKSLSGQSLHQVLANTDLNSSSPSDSAVVRPVPINPAKTSKGSATPHTTFSSRSNGLYALLNHDTR